MTDDAEVPLHGVWTTDPAADPPPARRIGTIAAGFAALAASAALAWWAAAPDHRTAPQLPAPALRTAPLRPPPVRYAADEPDPGQVRRAWGDVRRTFTKGGGPALVQGSLACAQDTPAHPGRLDYCLAYDDYAAEVVRGAPDAAGQADWFAGASDRDLALARSVLPEEVDAANRLAQVSALTTAVLPKPKIAPRPTVKPRRAHVRARHRARTAHPRRPRTHSAEPPKRSPPPPPAPRPPDLPPH